MALQNANLISNGGRLSASYSPARLISIMQSMPVVVARRDGKVVGFLVSSTRDVGMDIPILRAMLEAYPSLSCDAYVYGPICVDAQERGKGLAFEMFKMLRRLLPRREGVLFIRCDNESSIRSHRKMGMREVARFTFGEDEHIVMTC